MPQSNRVTRLIINGKSAGDPALRSAVGQLRDEGHRIDIRVTWEGGDAARYAVEAAEAEVDVVIAGGGDGTVNEVSGGLLSTDQHGKTAVAVLPYGTANDFAAGCGIPIGDPLAALRLAVGGDRVAIDVGQANDRYFVNVASGGFAAEVTTNKYVAYAQLPSLKIECDEPLQVNLDGEPVRANAYEFRVLPKALEFVLPPGAPLTATS